MQMQANAEEEVQVRLEKFLSWLLDARWFPETDREYKSRINAEQKRFLGLLHRLEAYAAQHPHLLLSRSLADLREYAGSLADLLKPHIRRSPVSQITSNEKGQPEVASRLFCAKLVLKSLGRSGSVYGEMQRLLANPVLLPHPGLGPKTDIHGQEIKARPVHKDLKSLQSAVTRFERKMEESSGLPADRLLRTLYREYLWCTQSRLDISESESEMLTALSEMLPDRLRPTAKPTAADTGTFNMILNRKVLFGSVVVEPEQMSRAFFAVPSNCAVGKVSGVFTADEQGEGIEAVLGDSENHVLFQSGNVTSGTIEVEDLRPGYYALAFLNRSTTIRKVVRGDITLSLTMPTLRA